MSKNFVHAGRRLQFTCTVAHKAGDLVYEQGFYGVVQDDCVVGRLCTLILEGVWALPRLVGGANLAPGTKVYASPTLSSTGLIIGPQASLPAGGLAFGRTFATSNASQVWVQLFNPNQS